MHLFGLKLIQQKPRFILSYKLKMLGSQASNKKKIASSAHFKLFFAHTLAPILAVAVS